MRKQWIPEREGPGYEATPGIASDFCTLYTINDLTTYINKNYNYVSNDIHRMVNLLAVKLLSEYLIKKHLTAK